MLLSGVKLPAVAATTFITAPFILLLDLKT